MNVADKTYTVTSMHAAHSVVAALLGGTDAMRAAGRTYLPQWAQESNDAYAIRLSTATLLPVLKETVRQMVGRVFYQDMDTEKVASALREYLPNIDLRNNSLSVFCAEWFADALAFGASFAVADYPFSNSDTLADAREMGLRPYAVLVKNSDVLGFRSELRNGVEVCTQFRYMQTIVEQDGEFGEKLVEQVNVLEAGLVRKYRKNESGDWYLYAENPITINGKPADFVPVVDLVFEKSSFFIGRSPLLELAYLNVKHWQSQSDQDNITHYVRVPLLVFNSEESAPDVLTAAAGNMISVGLNGNLSYVEHSGAAIAAGERALEKLENDMLAAGAKLLTRTKLALTDSQARDEQGKEVSQLRHYANLTEDAIGRLLDCMARWQGLENGGVVELSGNIESDSDISAGMDIVLKMNAAGVLSDQSLFNEAKRRGIVSDMLDWKDEESRLDDERESSPPAMFMAQSESLNRETEPNQTPPDE